MKSTVDKTDGLGRKLNIQVPEDIVRGAFDKVYKGIQRNAAIKGFRKGKAPLPQIKLAYADRVRQDVLNDLISESYSKAIAEHKLNPLGYPQINIDNFEENAPFHFTAEIEIRPEVKVSKYEGLEVEKEKLVIDDARVEKVLENLRGQSADFTNSLEDRPLQNGDFALIDFDGFVNGAPLDQGSAKDFRLELGSNSFIPGFEEGLLGAKVGATRELTLSFPVEYHNKEIAGQPVLFKVAIKAIQKKALPELNDDFAKKTGKFETLEELKKTVREDLTQSEEKRVKDDVKSSLLKALVNANPIEVPKTLQADQKNRIIEDTKERMRQQGMNDADFEEYRTKWNQDFEDAARFTIHTSFLIDSIADEHNLYCSDEDLEARFQTYVNSTGIDLERIKGFYGEEDRKRSLMFQITEEKVVEFLLSKAKIKEVTKKQ